MAERAAAGLSRAEARRFAWTVGAAFVVLGGVAAWRGRAFAAMVLFGAGALLLLAGLAAPGRLGPVYRAWMGLAVLLSRVTTPIVLAIMYFLILTPIALVARLVGRNPIDRRPVGGSYWVERPAARRRGSDLRRQF